MKKYFFVLFIIIFTLIVVDFSLNYEVKAVTTCGQAVSYGGQSYNTVQIGTQCWFKENLNAGSMIGNTEIPDSTAPTLNDPSTVSKWCYNNSSAYCASEGGLYTWAEANAQPSSCNYNSCSVPTPNQGICPAGWHIPTDAEFYTLENYLTTPGQTCDATRLGYDCSNAGIKLVLGGSSGFDAIGAGNHETTGATSFFDKREPSVHFWSSSPAPIGEGYSYNRFLVYLYTPYEMVGRDRGRGMHGLSVRCLADSFTATPSCTTWTYSDWNTCSASGQQTRTVISSSPSGCAGGSPVLSQSCTYVPPVCSSWTYSDWSSCSSGGRQTRSVTSSSPSSCTGGSPIITQSCSYTAPTCTSWTYSGWGACLSNGQQTRTIASSSPSNCTGGNPILSQSCTYIPSCASSDWSCTNWNTCSLGDTQTRTCNKTSNCQGGVSSPATSQSCAYTPVCTASDWSCSDWGTCSAGGNQTRVCTKASSCDGGVSSPATKQTCTPPCAESKWSCSGWGNCQEDGTQTRECAKTFDCSTDSSQPPSTLKYCSYTPKCTADTWDCDSWSTCSPQGVQGRSCRKTFDCQNIETKAPETSQYCQSSYQQPASLPDDDIDQDFIIRSTVKLACYLKDGRTLSGVGSGTIIDPRGIILTNNHVVKGTIGCLVGFQNSLDDTEPDYREIADISKISTDPNLDIALLKIRKKNNDSRFSWIDITKGINYKFKNRERLYIYGYPVYLKEEKMKGISNKDMENILLYSNMSPTDGIYSGNYANIFIKTSAKIEHGNSGGGAYTQSGTFIGIPTAAMSGDLESLGLILTSQKINQWLNNSKIAVSKLGATISPVLARVDMKNTRIIYINVSDAKVLIYSDKTKKKLLQNRPEVVQILAQPTFQITNIINKGIMGYYVYFGSNLNTNPVKSGRFITKNEFTPSKIIKDGTYYFIFKAKNKDGVISDSFITEYTYKAPKVIKKK